MYSNLRMQTSRIWPLQWIYAKNSDHFAFRARSQLLRRHHAGGTHAVCVGALNLGSRISLSTATMANGEDRGLLPRYERNSSFDRL